MRDLNFVRQANLHKVIRLIRSRQSLIWPAVPACARQTSSSVVGVHVIVTPLCQRFRQPPSRRTNRSARVLLTRGSLDLGWILLIGGQQWTEGRCPLIG